MKQHPVQLDSEQERQCKALAKKWGLPAQRYISRVIARCLERVYQQEINRAVVESDNNALALDANPQAVVKCVNN